MKVVRTEIQFKDKKSVLKIDPAFFCIILLVLFRCGHYERALEVFHKCGNWRQVFCLATGKLVFSTEQILHLARSMSGMQYISVYGTKYEVKIAVATKLLQVEMNFYWMVLQDVFIS